MTLAHGTTLTLSASDGRADAYLARPADSDPHPPVLLYTDILGLRPSMQKIADRVAAAGYTVFAPNVHYRQSPSPIVEKPEVVHADQLGDVIGQALAVTSALTPEEAMRDARIWLDWLRDSPHTTDGPMGITGYCYGGMLCLRTAGTYPEDVAAAAIIHGSHLITDAPDSPHLVAHRIKAEVFNFNGDADTINPPEQVEHLNAIFSEAGVRFRSEMHPGAEHGFCASDLLPIYHEEAAERHFDGMLSLFDRTL